MSSSAELLHSLFALPYSNNSGATVVGLRGIEEMIKATEDCESSQLVD